MIRGSCALEDPSDVNADLAMSSDEVRLADVSAMRGIGRRDGRISEFFVAPVV